MSELKRPRIESPADMYGDRGVGVGNVGVNNMNNMPVGGLAPVGVGMGVERMFPCVRLRGLPFDVTEDDIRLFLGCDPVDILLVKRDGRFSGESYVVLGTPMQVEMSMAKNKTYMGRRYIEIFKAKKLDYYKAVVTEMLDGAPLIPHPATRMGPPDYGMQRQHQHPQMQQMPPMEQMQPPPPMPFPEDLESTTVLRLRGLPFSVRKEDIIRWFDDPKVPIQPLSPNNIHVVSEFGRPTGVAFVEFATAQDAHTAMMKDRQMLGTRYIEIFPSSREEAARYIQRPY